MLFLIAGIAFFSSVQTLTTRQNAFSRFRGNLKKFQGRRTTGCCSGGTEKCDQSNNSNVPHQNSIGLDLIIKEGVLGF